MHISAQIKIANTKKLLGQKMSQIKNNTILFLFFNKDGTDEVGSGCFPVFTGMNPYNHYTHLFHINI